MGKLKQAFYHCICYANYRLAAVTGVNGDSGVWERHRVADKNTETPSFPCTGANTLIAARGASVGGALGLASDMNSGLYQRAAEKQRYCSAASHTVCFCRYKLRLGKISSAACTDASFHRVIHRERGCIVYSAVIY